MSSVGYATLQIIPSFKGMDAAIKQQMGSNSFTQAGDKAGRGIGSRLVSGVGTVVKTGAKVVGATFGAAVAAAGGTALVKGFGRLKALEEANKMLDQMGLSAGDVKVQMDGLNRVLDGTPYSLNEGASAMASLISAGVPLNKTEKALTRVADAAAYGNVAFGEMSPVFQRISLQGRATIGELNQLADRNIPIFSMLSDAMDMSVDEVRKLASDGKLSAEIFDEAWDKAAKGFGANGIVIEGAAKSAGDTMAGSWANIMNALGRFGARIMEPGYDRLVPIFQATSDKIKEITAFIGPMIDRFAEGPRVAGWMDGIATSIRNIDVEGGLTKLFENTGKVIDRLKVFWEIGKYIVRELDFGAPTAKLDTPMLERFLGVLDKLAEKAYIFAVETDWATMGREIQNFLSGEWDKISGIFGSLVETATSLAPSIASIAGSLAAATAAVGVTTWTVFVELLQIAARMADVILVPALELLAGWMEENREIVTLLVAAYAGWKLAKKGVEVVKFGGQVIDMGKRAVKRMGEAKDSVVGFFSAGGGMDGLRLRVMGIADMARGVKDRVVEGATAITDWGKSKVLGGVDALKTAFDKGATAAKNLGSRIAGATTQAGKWVIEAGKSAAITAKDTAVKGLNAIKTGVMTAATKLASIAQGAFNAVMAMNPIVLVVIALAALAAAVVIAYQKFEPFRNIVDAIGRFFRDTVWPIFQTVGEYIGGFFSTAVEKLAGFWSNTLWPALQNVAGFITDTVVPVIQKIADKFIEVKDWVFKMIGNIVDFVLGIPGRISSVVSTLWDNFKNGITIARDWVRDRISEVVGFVLDIPRRWGNIFSNLWDGLKNGITTAKNWVRDRISEVVGFVTGLPSRIRTAASGMWDGIKNAFKSALNWIIDGWNSLEFRIPGFSLGPVSWDGFTLGLPKLPKFHSGGVVGGGMSGDEVVAKLLKGEVVLTRDQQARLAAGKGGTNIHVHNHFNGPVAGSDGERWVAEMTKKAVRKGLMGAA